MRLFSRQLIVKEFKDLVRDPRIWIPFILSAVLMPAMGIVVYTPMMSAAQKAAVEKLHVAIINVDKGDIAEKLIKFLSDTSTRTNIVIYRVNISNIDVTSVSGLKNIVEFVLRKHPVTENIVIFPKDFSYLLEDKKQVKIFSITVVKEISFIGSTVKSQRLFNEINNFVRGYILSDTGINPSVVVNPVKEEEANYIIGKKIILLGNSIVVLTSLSLASFLIPIILMIVSVTIMQMTATSMAVENEEKTLETLLTLPLSRTQILLSKLIGSFIVAAIGSFMSNYRVWIVFFHSSSTSISVAYANR